MTSFFYLPHTHSSTSAASAHFLATSGLSSLNDQIRSATQRLLPFKHARPHRIWVVAWLNVGHLIGWLTFCFVESTEIASFCFHDHPPQWKSINKFHDETQPVVSTHTHTHMCNCANSRVWHVHRTHAPNESKWRERKTIGKKLRWNNNGSAGMIVMKTFFFLFLFSFSASSHSRHRHHHHRRRSSEEAEEVYRGNEMNGIIFFHLIFSGIPSMAKLNLTGKLKMFNCLTRAERLIRRSIDVATNRI